MKKIYFALYTFTMALIMLPHMASAQLQRPNQSYGLVDNHSLAGVVGGVVYWILTILASLSILIIVVSGVIYITSGGDQGRVDAAKKTLTYAIVGLVIALIGYVIVYSVSRALGAG
jgi:hypothetical protein